MPTFDVPDKASARTMTVTLEASTKGPDGQPLKEEFQAELPHRLPDAIALEGADEVFRRYVNSKVIDLQGEKRRELSYSGGTKERKRAKYLQELGIS